MGHFLGHMEFQHPRAVDYHFHLPFLKWQVLLPEVVEVLAQGEWVLENLAQLGNLARESFGHWESLVQEIPVQELLDQWVLGVPTFKKILSDLAG